MIIPLLRKSYTRCLKPRNPAASGPFISPPQTVSIGGAAFRGGLFSGRRHSTRVLVHSIRLPPPEQDPTRRVRSSKPLSLFLCHALPVCFSAWTRHCGYQALPTISCPYRAKPTAFEPFAARPVSASLSVADPRPTRSTPPDNLSRTSIPAGKKLLWL